MARPFSVVSAILTPAQTQGRAVDINTYGVLIRKTQVTSSPLHPASIMASRPDAGSINDLSEASSSSSWLASWACHLLVRLLRLVSSASLDMVCASIAPASRLLLSVNHWRESQLLCASSRRFGERLRQWRGRLGFEVDVGKAGTKVSSLSLSLESPAILQGWAVAGFSAAPNSLEQCLPGTPATTQTTGLRGRQTEKS